MEPARILTCGSRESGYGTADVCATKPVSLQSFVSDCGIFGSWHIDSPACLLPAGRRVTRGTLHLTFACPLSPSTLLEPMTLGDENEVISMFRVLWRHPADI